ncbi:helix-turn-helix domain-containing protein [Spirillospora sp. CA-294931]|uniref:helix-turn-helix domain-containing protein n=1 Tax=Spirillospora sp. CA-294931 TaxID=3240042 RepID=UPI003D8A0BDB
MSGNELGLFLRARREAVTPEDVGMPAGTRRRTPGLRRTELATLAGISVEYLARLEQGRDRRPSAQVLAAIADALLMSPEDRQRLRHVAKLANGEIGVFCPGSEPPARSVRPTVRALLAGLEPAPAVLLNRLSDVLAHTPAYERLTRPLGLLDGDPPNLARFTFTDPRAREVYPDWGRVADARAGDLVMDSAPCDPHVAELAEDLTVTVGAPFSDRLNDPDAATRRSGIERVAHPEVGELNLAFETLLLPDANDQRILVYLAADEAASAALDRLNGRHPGTLRAV